MPIPFRDTEDIEELGSAAVLHVEAPSPASSERFGALLFINARGEPLEFVYNRIELISSPLWRPGDRAAAAIRRLAATLFTAATLEPAVLFCRAEVVPPHLFGAGGQIELDIPVGRVAEADEAVGYSARENDLQLETANSLGELIDTHIFWTPSLPTGPVQELFSRLAVRGLILEPYERAGKGLRAIYGDPLGSAP